MKLANVDGRLTIRLQDKDVDVETTSNGRFSADPQRAYERWDEFRAWFDELGEEVVGTPPASADRLGPPAPAPRQIFAIGLNYRDHAAESGLPVPDAPPTFTKFQSCLTGPTGNIELPEGNVDWEVELVVVIGRTARNIATKNGWDHVAGLTVGQDLSDRIAQQAGAMPQFSLAKSHPGFGPMGPVLVTIDELADPDDLELRCSVNGEAVQTGNTRDLVFSVPELVAILSATVTLSPGDVIFTGTPAGVGQGRSPQRFLAAGDELVTSISGIGKMVHHLVRTVS